jgi:glycosyltransferase involved in cell wall biosynthesis
MSAMDSASVSFVIPTRGPPGTSWRRSTASGSRSGRSSRLSSPSTESRIGPAVVHERHPDVLVLPPAGRLGEASTRNRAIRAATGDWIFFMDADDLAHRERVATTLPYVDAHSGCRAARAPFWLFSETADGPDNAWGMQRDFVAADVDECFALCELSASINDFRYLDIEGRSHELLLQFSRGAISSAAERRCSSPEGCRPKDLRCGVDWTLFVHVARLVARCLISTPLGFQRLHGCRDVSSKTAPDPWRRIGEQHRQRFGKVAPVRR